MKKTLLSLTFLFATSIIAHAQWTTSGNNLYTTTTGNNVIIGASSPLTINASSGLFPGITPKQEIFTGNSNTSYSELVTIRHNGTSVDALSRQLGLVFKLSNEASAGESNKMGGMLLESSNTYANLPSLSLINSNTRRLTIDYYGNVGINAASPVSALQLNSGPSKFSAGRANSADLFYGTSYIGFNAARSTIGTPSWTIDGDTFHNGGSVIYGDVFGNIYMAPLPSAGTDQRTLTDLDIKNSITFKVGNNGMVYAKAVSVQTTGWPDFVFKSGYQLPSLTEVKAFIGQNQHLPEIPSAGEMEKNGLNVGEMNKLLMKKVEELTLYAIENEQKDKEKDKLLTALQEQINALKQQLTAIQKEVKR